MLAVQIGAPVASPRVYRAGMGGSTGRSPSKAR